MNISEIRKGKRVRTKDVERKSGILAGLPFLAARKDGIVGLVTGPVKNHENAWWVRDETTGATAPYWFHELEEQPPIPEDTWRDGPR